MTALLSAEVLCLALFVSVCVLLLAGFLIMPFRQEIQRRPTHEKLLVI